MYSNLGHLFHCLRTPRGPRTTGLQTLLLKAKADPLHAMEALGGRGGIAPIHSRPRH
jgi:hypothetical protein